MALTACACPGTASLGTSQRPVAYTQTTPLANLHAGRHALRCNMAQTPEEGECGRRGGGGTHETSTDAPSLMAQIEHTAPCAPPPGGSARARSCQRQGVTARAQPCSAACAGPGRHHARVPVESEERAVLSAYEQLLFLRQHHRGARPFCARRGLPRRPPALAQRPDRPAVVAQYNTPAERAAPVGAGWAWHDELHPRAPVAAEGTGDVSEWRTRQASRARCQRGQRSQRGQGMSLGNARRKRRPEQRK